MTLGGTRGWIVFACLPAACLPTFFSYQNDLNCPSTLKNSLIDGFILPFALCRPFIIYFYVQSLFSLPVTLPLSFSLYA